MRSRCAAIAVALLVAGCAFEPHGTSGTADAGDAPEVDAPAIDAADATPLDAPDAAPVDGPAIDSPGLDACAPGPERCNRADDDCDGLVDETFPTLGQACDGLDSDACLDDVVSCNASGTGVVCDAEPPDDDVEACNGIDDDCDGQTDEPFPSLGQPCDGADGDACIEGVLACRADGTGVACSDDTATSGEACNATDDDCDGQVDEDFPGQGTPCDGADGDACVEGVLACDPATGAIRCDDLTDTTAEACNLGDDDCDGQVDEDFDLAGDVANCGQCGRACTNPAGTTSCSAGTCVPTCAAGALDCDGNPVNGCEPRDTNPSCGAPTTLGVVRGDAGADVFTRTGYAEAFFQVGVSESVAGGGGDIDAQIVLVSPPGANFDLFVTCNACGGATVASTTAGVDIVNIGRNDGFGSQSYRALIEVRWVSSTACGDWTLIVNGNVDTTNNTCGM